MIRREIPYARLSAFELIQYILIVFQKVLVDDVVQFRVGDVERSPCQRNDGCDGWMVDAALEDGGAYRARASCKDDFHIASAVEVMCVEDVSQAGHAMEEYRSIAGKSRFLYTYPAVFVI